MVQTFVCLKDNLKKEQSRGCFLFSIFAFSSKSATRAFNILIHFRSEQNIDQNSTNDVVKELANFAEEMIAGMTQTYYERAKLLAGNDQSRVTMLNLSSTTAYISNITKLAAAQNTDSVAAEQPVTQEENITEEFVPEDRNDATNNRKSRGRPSKR